MKIHNQEENGKYKHIEWHSEDGLLYAWKMWGLTFKNRASYI
jgi:hypothetical protein